MRDSGISPVDKTVIMALWSLRHSNDLQRRILRARIRDNQKWRKRFRNLTKA